MIERVYSVGSLIYRNINMPIGTFLRAEKSD